MTNTEVNFPQHLTPSMVKGITGFNLCTFLVGLEGWRRGLTLAYHNKLNDDVDFGPKRLSYIGRLYSLSNNDRTHYFFQSRGDTTSRQAVKITREKELTKKYLKEQNLPLLEGFSFTKKDSNDVIVSKAEEVGYPVIIKPTNGSLSQGVMLNLKNSEELQSALIRVRGRLGYKSIILERYFHGEDIRMYVIDGKVVAGIKRIPAQVTGDGIHTIEELIDNKNKTRENNPYLSARPIKINNETREVLSNQGYRLGDILEKSKTILVKNKSTLTQGVDLEDITETLPDNFKNIAIKAIDAIPGLFHASIDMITDGKEAYILEINSSANISMHLFPTIGQPRNVPAALVDYYFPETIKDSDKNQHMSFDYVDLINTLSYNYTDYIKIRTLRNANIPTKSIIVKGANFDFKFVQFITKNALKRRINGKVSLKDNSINVICATYNEDDIKWLAQQIKKYNKGKINIELVAVKEYKKEVNIGFSNSL